MLRLDRCLLSEIIHHCCTGLLLLNCCLVLKCCTHKSQYKTIRLQYVSLNDEYNLFFFSPNTLIDRACSSVCPNSCVTKEGNTLHCGFNSSCDLVIVNKVHTVFILIPFYCKTWLKLDNATVATRGQGKQNLKPYSYVYMFLSFPFLLVLNAVWGT